MDHSSHMSVIMMALCAMLAACASPAVNAIAPRNLYELPAVPNQGAHPVLIDNDSYYVQPSGFQGCNSINDAPSCGGG